MEGHQQNLPDPSGHLTSQNIFDDIDLDELLSFLPPGTPEEIKNNEGSKETPEASQESQTSGAFQEEVPAPTGQSQKRSRDDSSDDHDQPRSKQARVETTKKPVEHPKRSSPPPEEPNSFGKWLSDQDAREDFGFKRKYNYFTKYSSQVPKESPAFQQAQHRPVQELNSSSLSKDLQDLLNSGTPAAAEDISDILGNDTEDILYVNPEASFDLRTLKVPAPTGQSQKRSRDDSSDDHNQPQSKRVRVETTKKPVEHPKRSSPPPEEPNFFGKWLSDQNARADFGFRRKYNFFSNYSSKKTVNLEVENEKKKAKDLEISPDIIEILDEYPEVQQLPPQPPMNVSGRVDEIDLLNSVTPAGHEDISDILGTITYDNPGSPLDFQTPGSFQEKVQPQTGLSSKRGRDDSSNDEDPPDSKRSRQEVYGPQPFTQNQIWDVFAVPEPDHSYNPTSVNNSEQQVDPQPQPELMPECISQNVYGQISFDDLLDDFW